MFIACALLAVPLQASAQDDTAAAKSEYKKGREAFKAGKYQEAIGHLQRAYELKPHPALLRYMGDTYYKMNKAREAIEHYKRYLEAAPQAADREKIETKVRQLELIIGASEEEPEAEPAPAPVEAPAPIEPGPEPQPAPEPEPAASEDVDLAPTGEDREVPLALRTERTPRATAQQGPRDTEGVGAVTVLKWASVGLGVAGLAMGITFNRLAASDASNLENAVRTDCPGDEECGGNPDMNDPKVAFSEEHFDMQQSYKRNQAISIASFVTGGVAVGAAVALFLLDRPDQGSSRAEASTDVALTPVVGPGLCGVSGELSF
jgi:tetratricopeptide (TPR) repeat protein